MSYNHSMISFSGDLRIHAWGGLGSQLFAIAAATGLRKKYPRKRVQIVLHSGGVTRRLPEVVSLYPDFSFEVVDDFIGETSTQNISKLSRFVRLSSRTFLTKSGLLSDANIDSELTQVKPWCRSLRGHYSYATIEGAFIGDLYERLSRQIDPTLIEKKYVAIHYRLGDLLNLKEKSFVAPGRIKFACAELGITLDDKEVSLYSDSPNMALKKLKAIDFQGDLKIYPVSAIQTILECATADYFIGTSSKISFWIAGIRDYCFSSYSKLPVENFREFQGLIHNNSKNEIPYR